MTNRTGILVQIREALGLKWQDFADKLGYTNIYSYRNIENGGVRIGPQLKKRLINLYEVNPNFLESGEGDMFKKRSQGNAGVRKNMTSGEEHLGHEDVKELKEMLARVSDNMMLLQETISKQAEIIKNLEYRNGRITDQLLNQILKNAEETGEKVVVSKKRSA